MAQRTLRPLLTGLLTLLLAVSADAATVTVDSAADSAATDGVCTLREALINTDANTDLTGGDCAAGEAMPIVDTVAFAIPGAGPHVISVTSSLPQINETVTIDGLTQPANGGPAASCTGGPLLIALQNAGFVAHGLDLDGTTSNGSLVRGLAIGGFEFSGIEIDGSSENTIQCNFLGTNPQGTASVSNDYGIRIRSGASDNLVGTDGDGTNDAAEGNLLSGNTDTSGGYGVQLADAGTTGNVIAGNRIGTDVTGTLALANRAGVRIRVGASDNVVGTNGDGTGDAVEGNIISGNDVGLGYGVYISDPGADDNIVAGNLIGTDATGTIALANKVGVRLRNDAEHTIVGTNGDGTSDDLEGNVISGNTVGLGYGVRISDAGTDGSRVSGNRIGTNAAGTAPLGNINGIRIQGGASDTLVGTDGDGVSDELERNIISGNDVDPGYGLHISDASTTGTVIAGNYIGTDVTGTLALGNFVGVRVRGGAGAMVIGTNGDGAGDAAEANVISGHTVDLAYGLYFTDTPSSPNRIAGNLIGLNAAGDAAIPNGTGIRLSNGATDTIIGTNGDGSGDAVEGNVLSGHLDGTGYAIHIAGAGASRNTVAGNRIGTDVTGLATIAGASGFGNKTGVRIRDGATNNTVGTNGDGVSDELEANLVAGHESSSAEYRAIRISDPASSGNRVVGNVIGVAADGSAMANEVGVLLQNDVSVAVADNRIEENDEGVKLSSGAVIDNIALISRNNCIVGNLDGFVNSSGVLSVFENNWWGAADGPSGAGTGSGDSVTTNVDYAPFRTAAVAACTLTGSLRVAAAEAWAPKAGDLAGALRAGLPPRSRDAAYRLMASGAAATVELVERFLAEGLSGAELDPTARRRALDLLAYGASPEAVDALSRLTELDASVAPTVRRLLGYALPEARRDLVAYIADTAPEAMVAETMVWLDVVVGKGAK